VEELRSSKKTAQLPVCVFSQPLHPMVGKLHMRVAEDLEKRD